MNITTPEERALPDSTAVAEWRSMLAAITAACLLFETATGLVIYLWPFGIFAQFSVLLHTLAGLVMLLPVVWYLVKHWWVRKKGNLSHYQLLGYIAAALLAACIVSGLVVTWQGVVGPRMSYAWDVVHLITGIGAALFVVVHLLTVIIRKVNRAEAREQLRAARRVYYLRTSAGGMALLAVWVGWTALYQAPRQDHHFPDDYNWRFGEDRPFAPSLARVEHSDWNQFVAQQVLASVTPTHREDFEQALHQVSVSGGLFARIRSCAAELDLDAGQQQKIEDVLQSAAESMKRSGALQAKSLAGSAACGTAGCHEQIYEEWLPSAHRYSSMDDMFQRVQQLMSAETSPEHTRYCAGCHDPISLFSGAKNAGNITLSVLGADEGISCLVCHSIVQTDVQGNGDYTIRPPQRYVYENHAGRLAKLVSDFLIRTYPQHHIHSYARPLYKTAEFCGACHKQYVDKEVNTDIGKVQGQNQYDSWKNSRWHHADDPTRTISCRECHMPLTDSQDPASGDETDYNRTLADGKHRSHRTLASNQYIPTLQQLAGCEKHVELTEKWLRGEIEIPEIADKWTTGPVVRMEIAAPERITPGETLSFQVMLTNNKTGHDFPTGPLDMIESWIELRVTDDAGEVLYHSGHVGEDGRIEDPQVWFKADGFDRRGELIDRHNLWDLVGASYKRSLYPGVTDSVQVQFQCPSMARGRVAAVDDRNPPGSRAEKFELSTPAEQQGALNISALLWYRKANPEFLNRVYGSAAGVRSPISEMTRAHARVWIDAHGAEAIE